jgi:hypothetical protein
VAEETASGPDAGEAGSGVGPDGVEEFHPTRLQRHSGVLELLDHVSPSIRSRRETDDQDPFKQVGK